MQIRQETQISYLITFIGLFFFYKVGALYKRLLGIKFEVIQSNTNQSSVSHKES